MSMVQVEVKVSDEAAGRAAQRAVKQQLDSRRKQGVSQIRFVQRFHPFPLSLGTLTSKLVAYSAAANTLRSRR